MSETLTPRTDAMIRNWPASEAWKDFARILERELQQATKELDEALAVADGLANQFPELEWICPRCNVAGNWFSWESAAEPGKHKCDVCLEAGRSGKIFPKMYLDQLKQRKEGDVK